MNFTTDEKNLIVLDAIYGVGRDIKLMFTDHLTYSVPQECNAQKANKKAKREGIYEELMEKMTDSYFIDSVLFGLQRDKVIPITYFSSEYPSSLKEIDEPPMVLYCKGDISLLNGSNFAIVGSRLASQKIVTFTRDVSRKLASEYNIVTGLAEGIDTAAAQGALEGEGKVIGVVANGLNHVYPSSNARLYDDVEQNGLLISENTPNTRAHRFLFPKRNRIVASISQGVLVTSAALKSGSTITATLAKKYNKPLFALPYSLGIKLGEGCNELIKDGAYLTQDVNDILKVMGKEIKKPQIDVELDETEIAILDVIKSDSSVHISTISSVTNMPIFMLLPTIMMLEAKGLILDLSGNNYSIR